MAKQPQTQTPAETLRQAVAEMRRRSQNPCLRPEQRDQYAATADVFSHLAADMAFGGAQVCIDAQSVVDGEGCDHPDWTAALAAARAWLVPTPEVRCA